ncbi:LOW QUALITY PROTEIN: uncharacterized protein RCH25_036373 [Pelodytes ibericus]
MPFPAVNPGMGGSGVWGSSRRGQDGGAGLMLDIWGLEIDSGSAVASGEELGFFTDAAGSSGFGAYFRGSVLDVGTNRRTRRSGLLGGDVAAQNLLLGSLLVHEDGTALSRFQFFKVFRMGLVAWIIGHSFVFWAKRRAAARVNGLQLGFSEAHVRIMWWGFRGFGWKDVFAELLHLLDFGRRPDLVLFHAGGNDLGLIPQRLLVKAMKQDIDRLRDRVPEVSVIWSEIVPRVKRRYARDPAAISRCRIKLNRLMSSFVRKIGGVVVRHRDLEAQIPGYYRKDGVHLSDIGLDFLNMRFQLGLEQALFVGGGTQSS